MKTSAKTSFTRRCKVLLGSRGCFAAIMLLFILQALWIALTGRYPMAFDENFHLGIIRIYSAHISPFWAGQPVSADSYGAIIHDPSYLYHWLMNFPYRSIGLFTDNQTTQVLWLRFINIGLFAAALPLYRRLLLKTGASRALTHGCLAVFVLLPIVPLLAAQINYDNLLLPLTALILLLTVNFSEELRRTQRFNVKTMLQLLILGGLACLVKYAFLPIALAIAVYLSIRLRQTYAGTGKFWLSISFGWTLVRRRTRWLLAAALVAVIGLFAQRYLVNLVQYHKPVPDCAQVLSVDRCLNYGPWARDHRLEQVKSPAATSSPLVFAADWFYGMWLRTFFAVDGPGTRFQTRGPLVVPGIGAIVLASAAFVATLASAPRLLKKYNQSVLWLFAGVIVSYAGALWLDGYQSFLQTGQSVAINGRYLLLIMPLLLVILALGVNTFLRSHDGAKMAFGGLAVLCLLWGGGALTYILRSNPAWYWPNSPLTGANQTIQRDIGPLVPGYDSPTQFMSRN